MSSVAAGLSVPDELLARLDLEKRQEAELDTRLEAQRAARQAELSAAQARADAARLALAEARRQESEATAELERLRAELARLSSGLYGLRLRWVRFGEPALASLTPLVCGLLVVLGGALHRGMGILTAGGAIGGALVAVLLNRGARR